MPLEGGCSRAEIKIEKKKGIPVWAMLLGLILLALIIWAVVEMGDNDRPADVAGHNSMIERVAPATGLAWDVKLPEAA